MLPLLPNSQFPHLFRVLLLERLRLPLLLTEKHCTACHEPLDQFGRHRAACPHPGRLKKRAGPIERVMARVCREAGARVEFNALLRDMNVTVPALDERRLEVLAQDLPCFGSQFAIDVTLRSVLARTGEAQANAAATDGAVLTQARVDKETKHPEIFTSGRCHLVVVVIETGGRWSDVAADLVWQLAQAKSREVPALMNRSVALAWERRWTRMLSMCARCPSLRHSWSRLSLTRGVALKGKHPPWRRCSHKAPGRSVLVT